ncbi:hypothetical protein LJ737_20945 [Hymenobacter sp. 15J16-1T3B]|uniref:hypothetical protein n=1 Tax=Hymenobacter sp. 15J16-1T3B TaxID=2886941 RepID=UPI001D104B51|nr:hypothetical protein [Hymenobacter sp. 15J16-1T3B]MCC3159722.1 hypothetical protein [Hymenobacter sp. 15J16-1T3B]
MSTAPAVAAQFDFAKLTADVTAAMLAGQQAADSVSDGGSCNLDGVHLSIPRQREAKVVAALAEAGVHSEKGNYGWLGSGYMLNPSSAGQADKRYAACEAIAKHLKAAGYDACHFYLMD